MSLCQKCPGVHGNVKNLCKPVSKTYSVAISTALGGMVNALICADNDAAKAGIQYLKQTGGNMSFLPLKDGVQSKTNPKLRELCKQYGGDDRCKVAIDCLNFDDAYLLAFEHLLGNTVIVDNLQTAREIAYGDWGKKHKGAKCMVITLVRSTRV
jgi:chromosome segregation ATPase